MENFIWFGDRVLNLAHVVHFTVEDDDEVTALLANTDPKNATITVDGDDAKCVIEILKTVRNGRPRPGLTAAIETVGAPAVEPPDHNPRIK